MRSCVALIHILYGGARSHTRTAQADASCCRNPARRVYVCIEIGRELTKKLSYNILKHSTNRYINIKMLVSISEYYEFIYKELYEL